MKVVLALGHFDALHKGHRTVLGKAYELGKKLDATVVVTTFSKNLPKGAAIGDEKVVYTADEREYLIREMGLKFLVLDSFEGFFDMSATNFLNMILHPSNGVAAVVAGADYRFGKGAEGDINLLKEHCKKANVETEIVELYKENGEKISTSAIKELIINGKLEEANELLYRPYTIISQVVKGKGEGQKLGFPTANVSTHSTKLIPPHGIYVSETVDIVNRVIYVSVTSIGPQPTFNAEKVQIETHLIDYSGNLVDEFIEINLLKKIRDIVKFNSLDELKEQISKDIKIAKQTSHHLINL